MSQDQPVVSEAELQAYVDRALPLERARQVESWLAERPEQRARVADFAAQNQALRALFDPVLDEPVPARLRRPAPRQRSWEPLRYASALAASLVVGVLLGWFARGQGPAQRLPLAEIALPQRAALAHAVYTPEVLHPVEVSAEQEAHLVKWLSKRLDQPLKTPDLTGLGFHLIGGRLLPGGDKPAGQFMYENAHGRRLTVYVSSDLPGNRDTAFRFVEERGVNVFYWIDGPLGYALVAEMERGPLLHAAEVVYRQLSP